MEIIFYESGAFAVNRIHQRFSLCARVAFRHQPSHFVFSGRIKKEAQRVLAVLQKVWTTAPPTTQFPELAACATTPLGNLKDAV